MAWCSGIPRLAGLGPMSETELEKLVRSDQLPVPNEYAWGQPLYMLLPIPCLIAVMKVKFPVILVQVLQAGNAIYSTTFATGPARVGLFATGSSGRVVPGASYYGAMEMTGNLWEDAISVRSAAGRSFTGFHGDGSLNSTGYADVDFWPGINGSTVFLNDDSETYEVLVTAGVVDNYIWTGPSDSSLVADQIDGFAKFLFGATPRNVSVEVTNTC